MDSIDTALGACLASALEHLTIGLSCDRDDPPPASRVMPWLRFASQRVVGTLYLYVHCLPNGDVEETALELPACKRAKDVTLSIPQSWRLHLPPVGLFAALTSLTIRYGRVEGSELTALVCKQCPRLKFLNLFTMLVATYDFTICSDSLHSAWVWLKNMRRLEIVTPPRLELLSLSNAIEAHISASKLGKLVWQGDVYDPRRHQLVGVGNRLQLLQIGGKQSAMASLMRQFNEVDELNLEIHIPKGIAGYENFLNETNKLPKCKTLSISILGNNNHGLAPAMLHLLRSCKGTRALSIELLSSYDLWGTRCPPSCSCQFEENCRIDDISLDSLEEVKIHYHTSPRGDLEFVELLSRCNAPILKRLVIESIIPATPPTKETCEKIHGMCRPNIEVEFYVLSAKGLVRWD
ncbi:unnamed protein product [Urochloa humidicola]